MKRSTLILVILVVVAVVTGIIIAVTLSKSKSNDSNNQGGSGSKNSGKGNSTDITSPASKNVSDSDLLTPSNSSGSSSKPTVTLSDPEIATPAFTFLAVGDWGATLGRDQNNPGSCCKLYKGTNKIDTSNTRYTVDYWSQKYIATLMGQSAAQIKPIRVIGHGDNIYWNGAGTKDIAYRMQETFEKVYADPALAGVKWVNVAGNHDIGGSEYICGDQDGMFRPCTSTDELLKYLDLKFDIQSQYKSPNGDRWLMKDHYYVESVSVNGVSVDIFNLDTNHADSHGASQVCCQCYGYSRTASSPNSDNACKNVGPGDALCAGGDAGMYKACMDKIEKWGSESMAMAAKDLAASTATFKIVNTHYSPHYHMNPERMKQWYKVCKDNGVHAWFNGHTHGFNHDVANWGTHFFENGGGGGIFTETSSGAANEFIKNKWIAGGTPYGFMELAFSKDWLKVQFVSFDKKWSFGGTDYSATVTGGLQRGHCWFVPRAGNSPGVECKSSINTPIGFPI